MVEQAAAISPAPIPVQPEPEHRVSAEEYMERYAHDHYEWAQGELVEMTPVSFQHDSLAAYFLVLLKTYFSFRPIGVVCHEPFVMRLDAVEARREPDLQVIPKTNPGTLTDTAMIGPADICVEIVSRESVARDYGEKFAEYEKAGVKEYWLVDPTREAALFYRLNEEGIYKLPGLDEESCYQTPLLPELRLHVPTLWQKDLPDVLAIVETVRAMVGDTAG
jgi:Uma2 family endonuclease